jgi:serine/threonine protein kinase
MIGVKLSTSNKTYEITSRLTPENRPNANIYLCKDQNGKQFIAKHFYNGKVSPVVGYSIYNHYGRRRDGSETVFYEIQRKTKTHGFLIKHHNRIWHNGHWIIILEYIEGELLSKFIEKNHTIDPYLTESAILSFAETVKTWHTNGFAHGDPHLDNAIVQIEPNGIKVVLIDYSIIHHRDFHYCQQYKCFESHDRILEDLQNTSAMGKGFYKELKNLEHYLKIGNQLSEKFIKHYHEYSLEIND